MRVSGNRESVRSGERRMNRRNKRLLVSIYLVAVFLGDAAPIRAQRADVVVMKNGDRITCSVKQLDRGRLRVETDYMGTAYLDWTQIAGVETTKTFEVELEDGSIYYGNLDGNRDVLVVNTDRGTRELPIEKVVYITEIKHGFFRRLDGSIDVGFSYKKAGNDVNYSIGGAAKYRTRRNETSLGLSSVLSDRDDAQRSFRNVLGGSYTHFLPDRWYLIATGRAEQNDELALDLRTNLGAAAGRYMFQSNRTRLSVTGGITTNRERFSTESSSRTSLEGQLGLLYDYFIHGDLGTDISSNLTLYPSLTDGGRYRLQLDLRYRQEIVTDLFVSFSGWYSYDNKAPVGFAETTSQEDFGLVTALGWEF